jgi:hypothetical protein
MAIHTVTLRIDDETLEKMKYNLRVKYMLGDINAIDKRMLVLVCSVENGNDVYLLDEPKAYREK